MKIILLKDDKKLGKENTITTVADSYAKNVLIPKQIAVPATEANLQALKIKLEKKKQAFEDAMLGAISTSEQIENLETIEIPVKCSESGKMFGAITAMTVSEALYKKGLVVSKSEISLKSPIKTLGLHSIGIKLFNGITAKLNINVVRE